jgi:sigma-B regulation protein RsbU (phosphoserine phosphatase)
VRQLLSFLKRLPSFDKLLAGLCLLGLLSGATGSSGGLAAFTKLAAYVAFFLLLIRLALRYRQRFLWSLRNRLLAAYLFIAVVPLILMLSMAALVAYIGYTQLAAYLIYEDMRERIELVADTATVALSSPVEGPQGNSGGADPAASLIQTAADRLPGLKVKHGQGEDILRLSGEAQRFKGLVQRGDEVWIEAVVSRGSGTNRRHVTAAVPLSAAILDAIGADLGPLRFTVTRAAREGDDPAGLLAFGEQNLFQVRTISAPERPLGDAVNFLDRSVTGISKMDVLHVDAAAGQHKGTLFASVLTRPSVLNRRLFNAPGDVGGLLVTGLIVVGFVFMVIEVGALRAGVALTRTITRAVADLYRATEFVQQGDFSYRVRATERDQLGALGESFNAMTSSVEGLIQEQRQRQRLENELAIAQQVQGQLFPQELPRVPGLALAAVCRAARVVSGDYYDFLPLGHNRLGIAIADISGKGISAALLMANLQAAIRSQVVLDGANWNQTAQLVSRLNRHLFLNTSSERYATLFYAAFDPETRMLHYTNAGHLPPLLLLPRQVKHLEEGGMVVGLFDGCEYQQGVAAVEPGSILVAYSDGLIEPENVYGEQFSIERVAEEVTRHGDLPPQDLAEALVRAAEEWAGTPEQADDVTVIIAKME